MANSDNVIRAGLTPKLRDIPNLIAGLTYASAEGSTHRVQPAPFPPNTSSSASTLYDPPIPEFSVVRLVLASEATETHPGVGGPSLTVVTEGAGVVKWTGGELEVGQGDVFFVGAATEVTFTSANEKGLVLYRAYVEAE